MSPKTPARHVAAGVDHDDVARLDVVEDVAVQLLLRIGVFVLAVEVLALGQELQRQRRPDDRLAGVPAHRPLHVRVADAHVAERAGDGGRADVAEGVDEVAGRPGDAGGMRHCLSTSW